MPRTRGNWRCVPTLVTFCCALLSGGSLAQAAPEAKPTINVVVDSGRSFISVTFSGGKPDASKAVDANEWRVIGIPRDPTSGPVVLQTTPKFYNQAQVRLTPSNLAKIPAEINFIVVQFDPIAANLTGTWKDSHQQSQAVEAKPAVKENPDRIVAASSKQSSALYFSGTYSPAIGTPPQYSIDAVVNPQFHLGSSRCNPRLGVNAQAKTDKRPTVDPDSYMVSPSFSMFVIGCAPTSPRYLSGRSVLLSWNILGPEFEAKGNDFNVVSAPMLSDTFRLWPFYSTPTTTKEFFTAYLNPTGGLEFGTREHEIKFGFDVITRFRGQAIDIVCFCTARRNCGVCAYLGKRRDPSPVGR